MEEKFIIDSVYFNLLLAALENLKNKNKEYINDLHKKACNEIVMKCDFLIDDLNRQFNVILNNN